MKDIHYIFALVTLLLSSSCTNNDKQLGQELLGSWQVAYYELSDEVENVPNDIEPAILNFKSENYDGSTGRNTFSGTYEMTDSILILSNGGITEITETEWGIKFTQRMAEAYDSEINAFVLNYSVWDKILRLEYYSGNFIVLTRL